jgi:hypothetical protein
MAWHGMDDGPHILLHLYSMDCVNHGYGKWVLGPWPWGWELPKLSEILPNLKSDFYTRHIDVRLIWYSLMWYPSWTSKPFFNDGDGFYMDGNGYLFGKKLFSSTNEKINITISWYTSRLIRSVLPCKCRYPHQVSVDTHTMDPYQYVYHLPPLTLETPIGPRIQNSVQVISPPPPVRPKIPNKVHQRSSKPLWPTNWTQSYFFRGPFWGHYILYIFIVQINVVHVSVADLHTM